jgi:hypothetical protein
MSDLLNALLAQMEGTRKGDIHPASSVQLGNTKTVLDRLTVMLVQMGPITLLLE